MSEPTMLADYIDEQTDTILALWRTTVERVGDVPEADRLSYGEFLDHVPAILDRLAERLRGRPTHAGVEGKKHGKLRWRQGYEIGEIINELAHLRTALCRSTTDYAREHEWDLSRLEAAYEAINEVLAEATAESVRQFAEDSRAETRAALAESKKRQREANAAEARFRGIAENSPVMIWRSDVDGRCDYVNQTRAEFRGRAAEEELGDHWADGIHPDERAQVRAGFAAAFDRREPFEITYRLLRHDGQYRWISDRGTPYYDTHGTFLGYLGSCLDITDRIELEAALEQHRARAEQASQHKTRLVAALSHDIRTPLNAVGLAAQLLDIHLDGAADSEVQECLRTIRHSVKNVLDLLGDLLNLSKLDAGGVVPEVTRFAFEPVLAECLSSIEPQARMKGLDIRLEPGNLAAASLETDRAKLKQIVANFLSNAVRYTEQGQIRLGAERRDGHVRITVADTGVGIDPKDQERIFDEFAVLEQPRRADSEGTGLGLAICRRLAGLLGGKITLVSTAGQGSTFCLVLPASANAQDHPGPAPGGAPRHPRNGDEVGTIEVGTIVVAEDHAESRQTLAKVLRRMGYRVLEASNGREALDLIADQPEPPLAVLMDVNMPLMDGVEATLGLRADPRFRNLPIFALTGDVTTDNQHRIGEAGVSGYLEKPVTWELLKQALASLGHQPPG